jgi:hypothetical protein
MHIPKTAGTSLVAALTDALRPKAVLSGFDRVLFGDYQNFASFDDAVRREVYFSADALPAADLVAGHMAYSSLRQRFPDGQFMTVLREPFSRLLSHWLYWRGLSDQQLAPWGEWADRLRQARRPLAAFLRERSVACQVDNLAVRMLLWPHPLIPVGDFIDPRHGPSLVAEARDRLAGFVLVDLVENPKLAEVLRIWLGRPFVPDRRNETGCIPEPLRRPLADELTQEALDLLAGRSSLDLMLWNEFASRCLPERDPGQARARTLLRNVARYAALLAAPISAPR